MAKSFLRDNWVDQRDKNVEHFGFNLIDEKGVKTEYSVNFYAMQQWQKKNHHKCRDIRIIQAFFVRNLGKKHFTLMSRKSFEEKSMKQEQEDLVTEFTKNWKDDASESEKAERKRKKKMKVRLQHRQKMKDHHTQEKR